MQEGKGYLFVETPCSDSSSSNNCRSTRGSSSLSCHANHTADSYDSIIVVVGFTITALNASLTALL